MIGVTGMLEVLARTELTPHQRQMVATAESSAQSLLQIIGDILDFSKIEADKLELAPATVDLRAVVRAAADTFVHTASAKGLLLDLERRRRARAGPRRRPAAAPPDPEQLPLQRDQVHRRRRDRGGRAGRGGRRQAAQTVELSVTDTGVGALERPTAATVRGVRPGAALDRAALGRHRPRARDLPAPRGPDGRRRDDEQPPRQGNDDPADRPVAGRRPGGGRGGAAGRNDSREPAEAQPSRGRARGKPAPPRRRSPGQPNGATASAEHRWVRGRRGRGRPRGAPAVRTRPLRARAHRPGDAGARRLRARAARSARTRRPTGGPGRRSSR